MRGFIRMAGDGWDQGWHERNGGNLSYRLTEEDVALISDELESLEPGSWTPICVEEPLQVSDVAGCFFAITAAGKYFRNIADAPEECLGIIEVDGAGERYRIRWGFADGGRPTSELPTHLLNQEVKKRVSNDAVRVIYHCHPVNITALTFVLPLDSAVFTRELWGMISECAMVFPQGVAVIDWMVPGSRDIAIASAEAMEMCDVVIWAYHGMFCAGADFDTTFGLMHTVEKAAEILVKVRSMGVAQPQIPMLKDHMISDENLEELSVAYGLELRIPEQSGESC